MDSDVETTNSKTRLGDDLPIISVEAATEDESGGNENPAFENDASDSSTSETSHRSDTSDEESLNEESTNVLNSDKSQPDLNNKQDAPDNKDLNQTLSNEPPPNQDIFISTNGVPEADSPVFKPLSGKKLSTASYIAMDANGNAVKIETEENESSQPTTIWSPDKKLSDGSLQDVEGGEGAREVWDSPLEFLLSCISMSVGLGNVWRFPFTAYKNGGGAFLIPYLVVLVFIGRPIYYLEMCLGQFSRFGQVKVWNMAPMFKGVGYGSMVGTICVVSYYCSIMAQTIFYFFASFAKNLPWGSCDVKWGGDYCLANGSVNPLLSDKRASELYYSLEVFPVYDNIDSGLGNPDWRLSLALLASWLIVFLSLVKGVKSSGKVAYFTAIFPYVVMLILLIRGVTLKGAWEGITFFITPQWDMIYEPDVWYAAVGQCFFSLATGFGPIIMFSSYNPFGHNVYKDALIISFMDTFTSLLAGCTIFAVLGYLSAESGIPIEDVTGGGPGLAFVSYPEAIAQFTFVPQLFAVLFFLMLFTLGIGSATSLTGGIITIICDQFPKWKKWLVTLIVCIVGFFSGLMYVTPGGNFMVDFIDRFGANFVIYIMAMVEVGAISWVYGLNNFCRDIEFMLKIKVGWYWKFCWGFFIPVGLFGIFVYVMVTMKEFTFDNVPYPTSAIASGWALAVFAIFLLPICAIHAVLTRKAPTLKEKFYEALRPTQAWGPQNPKLRAEWNLFKQNYDM